MGGMAADDRVAFRLTRAERNSLERFVRGTSDGRRLRRAEALLWLQEQEPVTEIARRLRVSRQTIYHWAARFSQRLGTISERLADGAHTGRPALLASRMDPIIDELIEQDPGHYGYAATVWTAPLLRRHLEAQHGVVASEQSVRLAIDRLGLRWKRPRYQLSRRSPTWRQAKGGANAASPGVRGPCC
jgi:transposase